MPVTTTIEEQEDGRWKVSVFEEWDEFESFEAASDFQRQMMSDEPSSGEVVAFTPDKLTTIRGGKKDNPR